MNEHIIRLYAYICRILFLVGLAFPFQLFAKADYTSELRQALSDSRSGTELIQKIKTIHQKAYEKGETVVYPRKKTFKIVIPKDFHSIQLTDNTDFNGCTFIVENTSKTVFLFELSNRDHPHPIVLEKEQLQANKSIPTLEESPKLLIVKDNHLWTKRYDYDSQGEISNIKQECHRYDLLFVNKHVVSNNPIASYQTSASLPSCQYINVSTEQKTVRNIKFIRESTSTAVTNLLHISYQYNVCISDMSIKTKLPTMEKDRFYYDQCIKVDHSAKIDMKNITVRHTYSSQNIWGYAIEMNNVLDCTFDHLDITAIRGGFNTTCSNHQRFTNCILNRVDVHYYGRDVTCENCTFKNTVNDFHVYNRFSSFYGKLVYRNCKFDHFLPVRIDSEYNAFTPFDIEMTDCTLKVIYQAPSYYNCICHIPILERLENDRQELREKYLPNIKVRNLKVVDVPREKGFQYYLINKNKFKKNTIPSTIIDIDGITYH